MKILLAVLPLAACIHHDFATSATQYNIYPGSFERARYLAGQAHDADMLATLDALGASHDHNGSTAKLASCIEARLDADRWQRQSGDGDAIDVRSEAQATDSFIRDLAARDRGRLAEPEQAWLATARFCVEQCGDVAAANGALARDRQYATTYLAACKSSIAAAEPAQQRRVDRRARTSATHALELARQYEAKRCFVAEAWALDEADRARDPAVHDQVVVARAAHPGELARADKLNHDPHVVELRRNQDRLLDRLGHAQREASTTELSIRTNDELQADLRDVRAELAALTHAAGLECPDARD